MVLSRIERTGLGMDTSRETLDIAILCFTYNHVRYIGKALDGFVMQKTEYKFKAFIHDDASTDGTQDILREYEKKYPDILHIIYETENQYSRGVDMIKLMALYVVGAKYIALCEGDDFWIYPHKLQKQCEYMETHPDTTLCVHNGINWDNASDKQYCLINELDTGYLTYADSIWFSKGHFPTCSFFFRTSILKFTEVSKILSPVSDDPIMYYAANNGQVYYMDKVWAIRTYMHPGSWNARIDKNSTKKLDHCVKYVDYLKDLYAYCNKEIRPYIMGFILGLLNYGIRYYVNSEHYSLEELRQATEKLKEKSIHHYDDLCNKCMIDMTKFCIDYPRMVDDILSDISSGIYIYGAGEEAAKLYEVVDKLGYTVEAFIVSKKSNHKEYMSHEIISVDEFDVNNSSLVVLIGLGRRYFDEVIDFFKEKQVKNRIIYNGYDIQI